MLTVKDLAWLCHNAEQGGVFEEWLHFLFTHSELEDLQKRLDLIAALLKEQETQREIAENHHVSIAKITRGANALKSASPQLTQFLKDNLT